MTVHKIFYFRLFLSTIKFHDKSHREIWCYRKGFNRTLLTIFVTRLIIYYHMAQISHIVAALFVLCTLLFGAIKCAIYCFIINSNILILPWALKVLAIIAFLRLRISVKVRLWIKRWSPNEKSRSTFTGTDNRFWFCVTKVDFWISSVQKRQFERWKELHYVLYS